MKVTSGKLQVGDVIHWKNGMKEKMSQEEADHRNTIWEDPIAVLLDETRHIKKITRKAKERELGPDDVMQVIEDTILMCDDIIGLYDAQKDPHERDIKMIKGILSHKFVIDRTSRREYKRRIKAAIEYIKTADEALVSRKLVEILEGKR